MLSLLLVLNLNKYYYYYHYYYYYYICFDVIPLTCVIFRLRLHFLQDYIALIIFFSSKPHPPTMVSFGYLRYCQILGCHCWLIEFFPNQKLLHQDTTDKPKHAHVH